MRGGLCAAVTLPPQPVAESLSCAHLDIAIHVSFRYALHFPIPVLRALLDEGDFRRRQSEEGVDAGVEIGFAADDVGGEAGVLGALVGVPGFHRVAVLYGDVALANLPQLDAQRGEVQRPPGGQLLVEFDQGIMSLMCLRSYPR